MRDQRLFDVCRALRHPDREDEWLACPLLPHLAEIVDVRIAIPMGRAQHERGVSNYEPGVYIFVSRICDVAHFSVTRYETRTRVPDILEQQLEQRDTRHRASADDDVTTGELGCGSRGEQHHRADGAVAGNSQVGKEQVALRIARVFNGGDNADVELTVRHAMIEIGRHSIDEGRVEMDDAPIDCPVNRIAVDVGNAAYLHCAEKAECRRSFIRPLPHPARCRGHPSA